MWEKATIKYTKAKGNAIVVPLKYERPLNIKTSFSNGTIISIEKQSNLWIYKYSSGGYRAEVIIILPAKDYQEGITKLFSGYILEEDWSGNRINTFRYKNGRIEQIKKSKTKKTNNTASREGLDCVVIDWYECDYIDEWGVGTNCTYLYSEVISCDEGGDTSGGEGGGGGSGDNGSSDYWGEVGSMPKLCGYYSLQTVGNSYTGSIKYLQQVWQHQSAPYENIWTNFVESCLTIPSYGITAAEASGIFNSVFNSATNTVLVELNTGTLNPTAQAISARMKTLIQTRLQAEKPGSVWNTNLCSGTLPSTEADWCP